MFPDLPVRSHQCSRCRRFSRKKQRGAGLPMAIFLITVMILIVVTIAQLQETTGEMEALDIQSTRAFYAAESGAEVGLNKVLRGGESCSDPVFDNQSDGGFPEGGLQGCHARVACSEQVIDGEPYYSIFSTGTCGSGQDRARRQIEVRAQ